MNTVVTYISNDEASIKIAFDTLMVNYSMDRDTVVSLMKNNPILLANIDAWTVELGETVQVSLLWKTGEAVTIGNIRNFEEKNYSCIQAHTTQSDWTPPTVPALWLYMPPAGPSGYPMWIQPTGAHDDYASGARVTHNGKNWESTVNDNVWEPGVFGWIELT